MATATAVAGQNAQAARQAQEAGQRSYEGARVSPTDVDFLVFLSLAMVTDALDIILELAGFLVAPKLIGMILDVFTVSIGWWIAKRIGRVINAKEHRNSMQQQTRANLQQRGRGAKGRAASTRNPIRRVWLRMFGVLLLELIPFVGLIPFWTIAVIGVLRQK